MLEELKTSNKFVGLRQSVKAVSQGKAVRAYIANDAQGHVVEPFEELCRGAGVPVVHVGSMKELQEACGVEVPTAVAVVLQPPSLRDTPF